MNTSIICLVYSVAGFDREKLNKSWKIWECHYMAYQNICYANKYFHTKCLGF